MASVPTKSKGPSLPDVFQGEIYRQVGKYARGAVLYAFEENGGPQGLADWAKDNQGEFYTKLFPKVIARESEVQHVRGVDDLMDLLDADYEVIGDEDDFDDVEDAETLPVDEAMTRQMPGQWDRDDDLAMPADFYDEVDDYDLDDIEVDFPDE